MMTPELMQALDWGFKITILIGGWFLKVLFDKLAKLEVADTKLTDAVIELRVNLPEHYVKKTEFREMGDNIFQALRRIEDKMDKKADREDH